MDEKEKRIQEEKNRLYDIFSSLDDDKINVAEGLISEAAFMKVTLQELKDVINKDGTVDIMPQGNYSIRRQSPEVQTYNTMIQRYNTTYKELFSLLPKEKGDLLDEEFEKF